MELDTRRIDTMRHINVERYERLRIFATKYKKESKIGNKGQQVRLLGWVNKLLRKEKANRTKEKLKCLYTYALIKQQPRHGITCI